MIATKMWEESCEPVEEELQSWGNLGLSENLQRVLYPMKGF